LGLRDAKPPIYARTVRWRIGGWRRATVVEKITKKRKWERAVT
jgi:hypothetical protein